MNRKSEDEKMYEEVEAWWIKALKEYLNWPADRSVKWAAYDRSKVGQPAFSLLFHETPAHWIVSLLIPKELMEDMREWPWYRQIELRSQIEDAAGGREQQATTDMEIDWDVCRRKLENILNQYGAKLPRLDETGE